MPEHESQLDYLHSIILHRLTTLDSLVSFYRKRHYIAQMSSVVLSATVTIIAGLKMSGLPAFFTISEAASSNIILVLGALITVLSAWGTFFSPHESWNINSEIHGKLRALQAKLEFSQRHPDFASKEPTIVAEIFAEYQKILSEYSTKWLELRRKSK